jgi:hypothetical protein
MRLEYVTHAREVVGDARPTFPITLVIQSRRFFQFFSGVIGQTLVGDWEVSPYSQNKSNLAINQPMI